MCSPLSTSSTFCFESLPEETVLHIFSHLTAEKLGQASRVSKKWQCLTQDDIFWNQSRLQKLFPRLKIIDQSVWEKCLDVKAYQLEFEPLKTEKKDLLAICRMYKKVKLEEPEKGFTLLTIPKGLSIAKLKDITEKFHQSHGRKLHRRTEPKSHRDMFNYLFLLDFCSNGEKTLSLPETPRVEHILIANSLLEGSRSLGVAEKMKLLQAQDCQIPQLIHVLALNIMSYISEYQEGNSYLFHMIFFPYKDHIKYETIRSWTKEDVCLGYDDLTKRLAICQVRLANNETVGVCPVKILSKT